MQIRVEFRVSDEFGLRAPPIAARWTVSRCRSALLLAASTAFVPPSDTVPDRSPMGNQDPPCASPTLPESPSSPARCSCNHRTEVARVGRHRLHDCDHKQKHGPHQSVLEPGLRVNGFAPCGRVTGQRDRPGVTSDPYFVVYASALLLLLGTEYATLESVRLH